jgi:hypothetical protein
MYDQRDDRVQQQRQREGNDEKEPSTPHLA